MNPIAVPHARATWHVEQDSIFMPDKPLCSLQNLVHLSELERKSTCFTTFHFSHLFHDFVRQFHQF